MGFWDRVNKTVEIIREQVATDAPQAPQSVAEGADLADKRWWPSAADVSAIAGVGVSGPEDFETAETVAQRFTGSDARGAFTFELHMVREEPMLAAGARGWIDSHAAGHERRHAVEGLADYTVAAAEGDSRFWCYSAMGDALFYVEATSPGIDMSKPAEGVLRKLYDWPE